MPAFEYVAADPDGRRIKGILEGDTPRQVRAALRERGLLPVAITEVSGLASGQPGSFSLRRGVPATDLAVMTRQLATLVRAALPLEEALLATAQQTSRQRLQGILHAVRARVKEGHTLADGFERFPDVFPDTYRSTVAAGEQSGRLDIVLERLADWTENRQQLRQKVLAATLYPVILVVIAILVTILLLAYVVPQVVQVFEGINQQLPWLTRALIAASEFLRTWGLWLGAGIAASLVVFMQSMRQQAFRRRVHAWLLRLPLVSRLVTGLNAARFARTLAILSGAGVPVLDALRISAATITNIPMREAVEHAAVRVREGEPIARSLAADDLFPPLTIHLIASGESSGRLDEMLERAAVAQEREMESMIGAMMAILGPALILAMALMVLVIVLAILLPIFELNQLVR